MVRASERNGVASGQQRQVVTDSVCSREDHHPRLPTSLYICRHLQVLRMYLNIYCHRQADSRVTLSFSILGHTQDASSLAALPITMAMMRTI